MNANDARELMAAIGGEQNWKTLDKYFEVRYNTTIKELTKVVDSVRAHQLQGKAQAYEEIRNLWIVITTELKKGK